MAGISTTFWLLAVCILQVNRNWREGRGGCEASASQLREPRCGCFAEHSVMWVVSVTNCHLAVLTQCVSNGNIPHLPVIDNQTQWSDLWMPLSHNHNCSKAIELVQVLLGIDPVWSYVILCDFVIDPVWSLCDSVWFCDWSCVIPVWLCDPPWSCVILCNQSCAILCDPVQSISMYAWNQYWSVGEVLKPS